MTTGDGSITTTYDASGRKLKQVTIENGETTTYHYMDGIEVKNNKLEAVYHDEGRVVHPDDGKAYHEYYLKDHPFKIGVWSIT